MSDEKPPPAPDRDVPPMPVWTTLEKLQAEYDRIRKARGKPMTPDRYREHLAKVLPIKNPEEYPVKGGK